MEKDKKSIPKIILHVCEYILLISILILIVFATLKACEKDVNAYSSTVTGSITDDDLKYDTNYVSKIFVAYFNIQLDDPAQNQLQISHDGGGLASYYLQRTNNNDYLLRCNYWNGSSNQFTDLGYVVVRSNIVISISLYFDSNNRLVSNIYYLNGEEIILKGTIYYNYYYNSSHTPITLRYNSQLWLCSRYSSNIPSGKYFGEIENELLGSYTPPDVDPYEYHEEYLFGDLVSSFLNIQFGEVQIGNTTFDFTLGLLLLFVLGLGALFIVVKVFLGG